MQSYLSEIKLSERISDQEIELDRHREAYKITASKLEKHQMALQSVNEFYCGLEATLLAEISPIVELGNETLDAELSENSKILTQISETKDHQLEELRSKNSLELEKLLRVQDTIKSLKSYFTDQKS